MKKEYVHPEIDISVLETANDVMLGSNGPSAGGVTDSEGWEGWL